MPKFLNPLYRKLSSFGVMLSLFFVVTFSLGMGLVLNKVYFADAAGEAVAWIGGASGDWNVSTNWDSDPALPDSDDIVTIDNATVTIDGAATGDFGTLNLGLGTNPTALVLNGDVGTGGNIVVANNATITQNNLVTQTLTGTLTVLSGGIITHFDHAAAAAGKVDFSAANIDIQSGGSINVDEKGYAGGSAGAAGGGAAGSAGYPAAAAGDGGGGGSMGGDGGGAGQFGGDQITASQTGICVTSDPNNMGGGGGGGKFDETGGDGGGLIILNATSTVTISGTITADGASGTSATYAGGGGAGGAIKITAATIAGTPASFTASGGDGLSGSYSAGVRSGGGGGGCALLQFSATSSISAAIIGGATFDLGGGVATSAPGVAGGAGLLLLKKTTATTQDDLFILGPGGTGSQTTQYDSTLTVDEMNFQDDGVFVVSGKTLVVNDADFLVNGDDSGTLSISTGGSTVFTPPTTFTVTGETLELYDTATYTSESSWNVTIGSGGAIDMRAYTVATALNIATLTINSGGTLTHGTNAASVSPAIAHVVNLTTSGAMTINSGGTVDVDGKGYSGSTGASPAPASNGPSPGSPAPFGGAGGGGGHGSNGGNGSDISDLATTAGGAGACVVAAPVTMGSGGGGGYAAETGGTGGGLAFLTATDSTMTINGTLTADGTAGGGVTEAAGGGAGGAFKLVAGTVAGTPDGVTLTGGAGGHGTFSNGVDGGGGGGGCMRVEAMTSTIDEIGDITIAGGAAGGAEGTAGAIGLFSYLVTNTVPSATAPTSITQVADGSGHVTFQTTISDPDFDSSTVKVEYSDDGGSTWFDPFLLSVSGTGGSPTVDNAEANQLRAIDTTSANTLTVTWDTSSASNGNGALAGDQVDIQLRVTPNDGTTDGSAVVSNGPDFEVDNLDPSGVTLIPNTATTTTQAFTWTAPTESNFNHYEIWYGENQSDVQNRTGTATEWDDDPDDAALATRTTVSTTITGLSANVGYYYKIWAIDDFGNFETVSDVQKYTAAAVAGAPTVTATSSTALNVVIDVNGNPASTTFSIQDVDSSDYVQADGTLGAAEVLQTYTNWGGATGQAVTGLSVNTQYTFKVEADNGDSVAAALSSGSSKYTLAAVPSAPSVSAASSSQITVTVNQNSNPSTTEFAIQKDGSSYLAADGGSSVSEVWQIKSAWGDVTVSGLSAGTAYSFKVKARNGDSTETALSSASSATTNNATGGGVVFFAPSGGAATPAPTISDPTISDPTTPAPLTDAATELTPQAEEKAAEKVKADSVEKVTPKVIPRTTDTKKVAVETRPAEPKVEKPIEKIQREVEQKRQEKIDVELVKAAIEESRATEKTPEEVEVLNKKIDTVEKSLTENRTEESVKEVAKAMEDLAKDDLSNEVVRSLATGETKIPTIFDNSGRPVASSNIKNAEATITKIIDTAVRNGTVDKLNLNGNAVSDTVEKSARKALGMDTGLFSKNLPNNHKIANAMNFGLDKTKLTVKAMPFVVKDKLNEPLKTGSMPRFAINIPSWIASANVAGGLTPPTNPADGLTPPTNPAGGLTPPTNPAGGLTPPTKVSQIILAAAKAKGLPVEREVNVVLVREGNLDDQILVARGVKGDDEGKAIVIPETPIPNGNYNLMVIDRVTGEVAFGGQIIVDNEVGLSDPRLVLPGGLEAVKGIGTSGPFKLVQHLYNKAIDSNVKKEFMFANHVYDFALAQLNLRRPNEIIVGYAEPGAVMMVNWKSIILSSVVVVDANGKFEVEVPGDLPEGQHEVMAFAYNTNRNIVSNVTRLFFRK